MASNEISPSRHFKRYAAAAVLYTTDAPTPGQHCRRIRATGAGSITVKRASDDAAVVLGRSLKAILQRLQRISGPCNRAVKAAIIQGRTRLPKGPSCFSCSHSW